MLLSFFIFILTFAFTLYGVEYVMEPFGRFLFVNPIEILGSLAFSIAYITGIAPKIAFFIAVIFLSIPGIILAVVLAKNLKKNRRKKIKL